MPTAVVLPPSLAAPPRRRRGRPSALLLSGTPLTREPGGRPARGARRGWTSASYLYVERGYQTPNAEKIVLWILFGLGAVLMLGGTLTATFLALSDARPDLATLSAVGAVTADPARGRGGVRPGSSGSSARCSARRSGSSPGSRSPIPLTRGLRPPAGPSHYLDIPWMLIGGLVVALPLLTALVVGLIARSRLPLVARLDWAPAPPAGRVPPPGACLPAGRASPMVEPGETPRGRRTPAKQTDRLDCLLVRRAAWPGDDRRPACRRRSAPA